MKVFLRSTLFVVAFLAASFITKINAKALPNEINGEYIMVSSGTTVGALSITYGNGTVVETKIEAEKGEGVAKAHNRILLKILNQLDKEGYKVVSSMPFTGGYHFILYKD